MSITLSPPQRRFVESTTPESRFLGGVGSGKTTAGIMALCRRIAQDKHPGALYLIAYRHSPDDYVRHIQSIFPDAKVKTYTGTPERVFLPARVVVQLCPMGKLERIKGTRFDGALVDDPRSGEDIKLIRLRVRYGGHLLITAHPSQADDITFVHAPTSSPSRTFVSRVVGDVAAPGHQESRQERGGQSSLHSWGRPPCAPTSTGSPSAP